uniref:Putative secreted protein n=1 Tax=Ixodes ricinus TaxID=34613 RepID=A0A6B0UBC2_IXORI
MLFFIILQVIFFLILAFLSGMSCECCVLRVSFPSENTHFLFLIVFRTDVNPVLKIWWNVLLPLFPFHYPLHPQKCVSRNIAVALPK